MESEPREREFGVASGREPDSDYEGSWVSELNTSAHDVLAQTGDVPRVAREWARIEELGGNVDAVDAQAFIDSTVGLSRTRETEDLMLCWTSLQSSWCSSMEGVRHATPEPTCSDFHIHRE